MIRLFYSLGTFLPTSAFALVFGQISEERISISGTVLENIRPPKNAIVTLFTPDAKIVKTASVDRNGNFTFTHQPSRQNGIIVQIDGKKSPVSGSAYHFGQGNGQQRRKTGGADDIQQLAGPAAG